MSEATQDRSRASGAPSATVVVIAGLIVAFLVVVTVGVVQATRRVGELDHRRSEALAVQRDPADTAGAAAIAFRSFRSALHRDSRFALVYDASIDRNQRGYLRLFAGYYLYPAVAVSQPSEADAVMVFGAPPSNVVADFAPIAVVDGVWLGRRKPS
jgi:hypothetical protein